MRDDVHIAAMSIVSAMFDRALIQNDFRGVYVEALVETALGSEWRKIEAWAGWDLEHSDGTRLEVKQSALKQSWAQSASLLEQAKGSFSIREAKGHYEGSVWQPTSGRLADIYVFAWHDVTGDHCDHRAISQWQFFVVPTSLLPAGQKSIGVGNVKRLSGPVQYSELSARVMETKRALQRMTSAPLRAGVQGD